MNRDDVDQAEIDRRDAMPVKRRHKAGPGECRICDNNRDDSNEFHPPHDASDRCESGKRKHCSCDTCF